jgi:hypothetical protein
LPRPFGSAAGSSCSSDQHSFSAPAFCRFHGLAAGARLVVAAAVARDRPVIGQPPYARARLADADRALPYYALAQAADDVRDLGLRLGAAQPERVRQIEFGLDLVARRRAGLGDLFRRVLAADFEAVEAAVQRDLLVGLGLGQQHDDEAAVDRLDPEILRRQARVLLGHRADFAVGVRLDGENVCHFILRVVV